MAVGNEGEKVKMSRVAFLRTFNAMCTSVQGFSTKQRSLDDSWMVFSSDAYPMSKFDMTSPSSGDLINEQSLNLCLKDC